MKAAPYYKQIIARGGGIITCGQGRGVFVTPACNAARCPAGWGFVPIEEATVGLIQQTVQATRDWKASQ